MNQSVRLQNKAIIAACCCLFLIQANLVYADSVTISPQPSRTPKPVEYTLPYPGLLPDHPLYFFRAVRDTVQDMFTSNALKKAEFHLLQADKRVSASMLLAEKKETLELGGATAIESQDHFEKALDALDGAKKQGLAINDLANKLVLSNEKHKETLALLAIGANEHAEAFTKAAERAQTLGKRAKTFLPTK